MHNYYSQFGQDKYFDAEIFNKKISGTFIEIGAHNGISFSNTYFFEKERNWKGICIEPIPERYKELQINRKCIVIQGGISGEEKIEKFTRVKGYSEMLSGISKVMNPEHLRRIRNEIEKFGGEVEEIEVNCYKLQSILKEYDIKKIDYCSIDTEGSEMNILSSIDFKAVNINYFSIENDNESHLLRNFMKNKGYILINRLGSDDIFARDNLIGFFDKKRLFKVRHTLHNLKNKFYRVVYTRLKS